MVSGIPFLKKNTDRNIKKKVFPCFCKSVLIEIMLSQLCSNQRFGDLLLFYET